MSDSQQELTTVPEELTENSREQAIKDLEIRAATVTSSYMNPQVWKQMLAMADTFAKSKALPSYIQNVYQAQVVLQAGLELGLKPIEAFNSLYIVNGAINLWGKAVIRQLKRHGYSIVYNESTQEMCKATVSKGKESYTEELNFEEATAGISNVSTRPGWKPGINRKMKLRYNVLSVIIKSYIPEVLGSAEGIAEVAQDFEDAEIVDSDPVYSEPIEQPHSKASDFINRKRKQADESPKKDLAQPDEDSKKDPKNSIKGRPGPKTKSGQSTEIVE